MMARPARRTLQRSRTSASNPCSSAFVPGRPGQPQQLRWAFFARKFDDSFDSSQLKDATATPSIHNYVMVM